MDRGMLEKMAAPHRVCRSTEGEFLKFVEIFVLQGRQKRSHMGLDPTPSIHQRRRRRIIRGNQGRAALCASAAVDPPPLAFIICTIVLRTDPLCPPLPGEFVDVNWGSTSKIFPFAQ
jgi:hypothetical protein